MCPFYLQSILVFTSDQTNVTSVEVKSFEPGSIKVCTVVTGYQEEGVTVEQLKAIASNNTKKHPGLTEEIGLMPDMKINKSGEQGNKLN